MILEPDSQFNFEIKKEYYQTYMRVLGDWYEDEKHETIDEAKKYRDWCISEDRIQADDIKVLKVTIEEIVDFSEVQS